MGTEIQTVKQQVRIKNWEAEVEACNASGLSVQQWCRQNGISAKHITITFEKFVRPRSLKTVSFRWVHRKFQTV